MQQSSWQKGLSYRVAWRHSGKKKSFLDNLCHQLLFDTTQGSFRTSPHVAYHWRYSSHFLFRIRQIYLISKFHAVLHLILFFSPFALFHMLLFPLFLNSHLLVHKCPPASRMMQELLTCSHSLGTARPSGWAQSSGTVLNSHSLCIGSGSQKEIPILHCNTSSQHQSM